MKSIFHNKSTKRPGFEAENLQKLEKHFNHDKCSQYICQ